MWGPNMSKFTLTGGGSDFANRQKSLFDKLDEAEGARSSSNTPMETNEQELLQVDFDTSHRVKRQRRSEMKQFQGKESIFKRPEPLPPWKNRPVPDHKMNPHKWTKYSLDDVSQDDMSDKTNTSTALSFLAELRKRKLTMEDMDEDAKDHATPTTIVFKKPGGYRPKEVDSSATSESPVFRGSKRVMPEYIVGQKNKNKKSVKTCSKNKSTKQKELLLDHLLDIEGENNDSD